MKNYRDQTPKKSCLTCKHCYGNMYWEHSAYYCNFDGTIPPNPRENLSEEIKKKRRNDIGVWHKWAKTHRVGDNGICDNYEKGVGEIFQ